MATIELEAAISLVTEVEAVGVEDNSTIELEAEVSLVAEAACEVS